MMSGTTATEADFLGRLKYTRELSPVIYQDQFGTDYIDHYDLHAEGRGGFCFLEQVSY